MFLSMIRDYRIHNLQSDFMFTKEWSHICADSKNSEILITLEITHLSIFFLSPTPNTRISIFGSRAAKSDKERGVMSSGVGTRHERAVFGNRAMGPYLEKWACFRKVRIQGNSEFSHTYWFFSEIEFSRKNKIFFCFKNFRNLKIFEGIMMHKEDVYDI